MDNLSETPAERKARAEKSGLPYLSASGNTSIHLFELKRGVAEYHVDGHKILSYFRDCVKPIVNKLYPGKKVYVVMDNASTHLKNAKGSDSYFNPLVASKAEIGARMEKVMADVIKGGTRGNGKSYILPVEMTRVIGKVKTKKTVNFFMKSDGPIPDGTVRYDVTKKAHKNNFDSPYLHELQNAAVSWTKKRAQGYLISELQQWAIANKWCIIYSVPYAPDSQPIEMTWSHIKYNARSKYTKNEKRTFEVIAARLYQAFVEAKWARATNASTCPPGARAAATCRRAQRYTSSSLSRSTSRAGQDVGAYEMSPTQSATIAHWKGTDAASAWTEYYLFLKYDEVALATGDVHADEGDETVDELIDLVDETDTFDELAYRNRYVLRSRNIDAPLTSLHHTHKEWEDDDADAESDKTDDDANTADLYDSDDDGVYDPDNDLSDSEAESDAIMSCVVSEDDDSEAESGGGDGDSDASSSDFQDGSSPPPAARGSRSGRRRASPAGKRRHAQTYAVLRSASAAISCAPLRACIPCLRCR